MAALAWTDLVRLRRTPQAPLLLAGAVVVPYAAQASGAGRLTVLVAALAGFLTLLPMLSALRVVTRTPSIVRMLPFPAASARYATVIVPGLLAVLFGLGCGPALQASLEVPPGGALFCGAAVGLAALASAVRWVTGRPPDYSRPLVSTPAGGVPTNLYGSAVRGFDVLLLCTAPLLLRPTSPMRRSPPSWPWPQSATWPAGSSHVPADRTAPAGARPVRPRRRRSSRRPR